MRWVCWQVKGLRFPEYKQTDKQTNKKMYKVGMLTCVYTPRTQEAGICFPDSLAARSLRCGSRSEVSVRFWMGRYCGVYCKSWFHEQTERQQHGGSSVKSLGLSTRDRQSDGMSEKRNKSSYSRSRSSFHIKSIQPGSFNSRQGPGKWVGNRWLWC